MGETVVQALHQCNGGNSKVLAICAYSKMIWTTGVDFYCAIMCFSTAAQPYIRGATRARVLVSLLGFACLWLCVSLGGAQYFWYREGVVGDTDERSDLEHLYSWPEISVWASGATLTVLLYFCLQCDGAYWVSHGYGINADIYGDQPRLSQIRSLSGFNLHSALLRQRLALDLHALLSQPNTVVPDTQSRFLESDTRARSSSLSEMVPQLNLGLSFAKLSVGRCIGEGSSSFVFMGRFGTLEVAAKRFVLDTINEDAIRSINSELMCAHVLGQHQSIVQLHGFVVEPPYVFHVYELCSRGTIKEVVQRKETPSSFWFSMQLAIGCAKGLAYLHSFSPPFVHRDIKPTNYLVREDWSVKLADFGESKTAAGGCDVSKSVVGTPLFMAPEVWRVWDGQSEQVHYDEKVDVYGLAMVIWVLAARQYPFQTSLEDRELRPLCGAVCSGQRPPIDTAWPSELAKLLSKGWDTESCHRPSVEWTLSRLQEISHRAGVRERALHDRRDLDDGGKTDHESI